MKNLFFFHRPGLIACTGKVVAVENDTVTIAGDIDLPVSQKRVNRRARLHYMGSLLSRLKLKLGDEIIAITGDNSAVGTLFQGGETSDCEYELYAYSIRYSGVFDFAAFGGQTEMHIFAGTILKSMVAGRYVVSTIHLRNSGDNTTRNVCEVGSVPRPQGQQVTFVTGAPKRGESGILYFPVTGVNE